MKIDLLIDSTTVEPVVNSEPIVIELPYGIQGPPGEADKRIGYALLTDPLASSIQVGNTKAFVVIPPELNGFSLIFVSGSHSRAATSGNTSVTFRRVREGVADVFMLSTPITIEANEKRSETATVQPVINPANRTVQTGDQIHFDIIAAGTEAAGVSVNYTFRQI